MRTNPDAHRGLGDQLGISASLLCILHCLALPMLLPIAATLGLGLLVSATAERIVLLATLVLAYGVLRRGRRHHHRGGPLILAGIGGLLYAGKQIPGETWEPVAVVLGGGLLMAAHGWNLQLTKRPA